MLLRFCMVARGLCQNGYMPFGRGHMYELNFDTPAFS